MKIFIYTICIFFLFISDPVSAFSQDTLISKKELKLQKKMDAAITDLDESKAYLEKLRTKYTKTLKKFEKANAKGKLSPNDVSGYTKSIEKQRKKIEKLKSEISSLEAYIKKHES